MRGAGEKGDSHLLYSAMIEKMKKKEFDCVKTMREIRDRVSAELAGKTRDEVEQWLHANRYSDPVLRRLARRGKKGNLSEAARLRTARKRNR